MKTIKIQYLLRKLNDELESLEYITVAEPKIDKSQKFAWGYRYVCEVYFSETKKNFPYYGINPVDTLLGASEFAKIHCQILLRNGYIIGEVESKEPWKLEKLGDNFLQEKINKLKDNPNISQEEKQKILEIIKDSFGGKESPIKDKIRDLI